MQLLIGNISIENIIVTLLTFFALTGIVALVIRIEKLFLRTQGFIIESICILAIIRLLYPFDFFWSHPIIYQGNLRHVFILINQVWNKDHELFHHVSITAIIYWVWFIGALVITIRFFYKYHKSRDYLRLATTDITKHVLMTAWISEQDRKGIQKKHIRILKSPYGSTPIICGFIHPYILIPEKYLDSDVTMKCIVAHEMWHVRCGDLYKKFILMVLSLFYWWFPPLRIVLNEMDLICELRVDKKISKDNVEDYIRSILHVINYADEMNSECEAISFSIHPISIHSDKSEMVKRCKKLTQMKSEKRIFSLLLLICAFLIFSSSFLFSVHSQYTSAEREVISREEGYVPTTSENSRIIKKDDGTYLLVTYLEEYGVETVTEYNSLQYMPNDLPMYNENGEQIKWPFFHR